MQRLKYVLWFIKCIMGLGNITDGSICWFSKKFFDIHDYPTHKGGDGTPSHFCFYTCPACNKRFRI